jgi:hypothetical protein
MHHIEKLNIIIVHDRTMRQGVPEPAKTAAFFCRRAAPRPAPLWRRGSKPKAQRGGLFQGPLKNIGTHINLAVIARHEKNVENCDAISCADNALKSR